ncbi:MAG: cyclic nucleotide-binding domain-containing protein [Deltaproteobacteria bacterium]|nr:cyclic nucleotide-binding domain-containing protein [Deltaproteobacteria bacterium]
MTSNVVLRGSLAFVGLGELLQQLGGNNSTGVLKLVSPFADSPGLVFIKDGNPVNAEFNSLVGIEALNTFFGWNEAEFEFLNEPVTCDRLIKKGRMEIILDGLRMLDDGLIKRLGPESGNAPPPATASDGSGLPVIKGPLIDYVYVVDEEEFADGTEIVAQDRFGNWFWVILSGTVKIIRIMPEGTAPIVKLSDGAFIGSIISFLRQGNIRSATVEAEGNVVLGVLDSELIAHEYTNLSDNLQNLLISMDKRMKQVTNLCAGVILKQDVLADKPGNMKLHIAPEVNEETVFKIIAGEARIFREADNAFLPLCTLGPGDFIGNIEFLNTPHEPYSAMAFVSEDFEGEEFDLSEVRKEFDKLSNTFKNMVNNLMAGVSVTTGRILDLVKKKPD